MALFLMMAPIDTENDIRGEGSPPIAIPGALIGAGVNSDPASRRLESSKAGQKS
jgi:hypothetical protein